LKILILKGRKNVMKKFLVGSLMLLVLVAGAVITANAQYCRTRGNRGYNSYNSYPARYVTYNRGYNRRYNRGYNRGYQPAYYSTPTYYRSAPTYYTSYRSNRPSYYRRHRNAINVGLGTGAGAIIGALAGGRRGAVLGALIGGGGAAAYTYGFNPKRRYYRRSR
jgi:hypothetical protein